MRKIFLSITSFLLAASTCQPVPALAQWGQPFGQPSVDAGPRPLAEYNMIPPAKADLGWIYGQDAAGVTELFYEDSNGSVTQITSGGGVMTSGPYVGAISVSDTEGVQLTGDGDGAITFCGLGNGTDECLTYNYDDVANTVRVSSSTGVILMDYGTVAIDAAIGTVTPKVATVTNLTLSGNTNGPAAASRIFLDAANSGRLTTVVPGGGSMAWGFAGSASIIFDGSNWYPQNNNGWAVGKAGNGIADIFLADTAYLNWANGAATISYDTLNGYFIFDREVHFGQGIDLEGLDADNIGEANIDTTATGVIYIGAATAANLISNHLSYQVTKVTSANIPAGDCAVYATVGVTGAVEGDSVTATPLATTSANGIEDVDLTWNAYVDGNDFVSIKACNPHTVGDINTDNDQEWRIELWRN